MADSAAVAQFCELTGANDDVARQFLAGSDLQTAVASYFAAQETNDDPMDDDDDTLGTPSSGQEAANPTTGGVSSSGPRVATIGRSAPAEDDDDDNEEEEARKRRQELYAGGGRSGLAIVEPNQMDDMVASILQKAEQGGPAPPPAGSGPSGTREHKKPSRGAFTGSGMTLGSDEAPSVPVPAQRSSGSSREAAAAAAPPGARGLLANMLGGMARINPADIAALARGGRGGGDAEDDDEDDDPNGVQVRHLTFWRDGFSVEDGPLMRYDEPRNQSILAAIKAGNAPQEILNVRRGQQVELRVAKRLNEDFKAGAPKPKKPFQGSGHRLGSPVPDVIGAASSSSPSSSAVPGGSSATPATAPAFTLDPNQPQTSIQVRLADGTKLVARLNLTHTVGDIRGFITASQPGDRAFTIQTTFPNKVLADDSQTVEQANLANAVIVQRWA